MSVNLGFIGDSTGDEFVAVFSPCSVMLTDSWCVDLLLGDGETGGGVAWNSCYWSCVPLLVVVGVFVVRSV